MSVVIAGNTQEKPSESSVTHNMIWTRPLEKIMWLGQEGGQDRVNMDNYVIVPKEYISPETLERIKHDARYAARDVAKNRPGFKNLSEEIRFDPSLTDAVYDAYSDFSK